MLKLFNTLTRNVEEFMPLNPPNVGMYTCGPTVYDFQHIGNFRTMIMSDILYRVLKVSGYNVKSVRNITDIDDKIIKNAALKNLPIDEFSKQFTEAFFNDLEKLNVIPVDVNPKATEHVREMVKYIEILIQKGLAYIKENSVYFDISKFPDYGKLSGVKGRTLKTGTRTLSDEYTKDSLQDFALWKSVNPDDQVGYDSPWGRGRPGWHIECSVMSQEYLGDTLDIHVGGVDLLFPHHENEIAQSEGKTGKVFVNFFIHGEMLLVDGGKMSKSLKNFYLLKDLIGRGFDPLAFRYLVLTAHYRDKLNFTWESLQAAQNTLDRIKEKIRAWERPKDELGYYWHTFIEPARTDLNMPPAVAPLHEVLSSDHTTSSMSKDLLEMDKILGLKLDEYLGKKTIVPDNVQKLINEREKFRKSGDFKKSDKLRKEIKNLGFEIEDTSSGPKLK